jgi:hypothetical protein
MHSGAMVFCPLHSGLGTHVTMSIQGAGLALAEVPPSCVNFDYYQSNPNITTSTILVCCNAAVDQRTCILSLQLATDSSAA